MMFLDPQEQLERIQFGCAELISAADLLKKLKRSNPVATHLKQLMHHLSYCFVKS